MVGALQQTEFILIALHPHKAPKYTDHWQPELAVPKPRKVRELRWAGIGEKPPG